MVAESEEKYLAQLQYATKDNAWHKFSKRRHFLLNLVSKLTRKVSFNFVNLSLKKAEFGCCFLHEGVNLN